MRFKHDICLRLLLSCLSILPLSCSHREDKYPQGAISEFDELLKEFKQPSKEYGTIPFFVWNDAITRQAIDSFMVDFKNAGCGGVFIHARPGLITPYLKDEWFDLFQYTLAKGKDLGIDVWIYDEYNYPSGFAGGNVPAQMPESYNQGQGLQLKKSDIFTADTNKYFLILKQEDNKYTEVIDLQAESGKKGNYYLFSKSYYFKGENDYYFHGPWYGGYSYVDVLYPGVTEKFIRVTMDGYEKYAGSEFGKCMPGIFTDEPHLNSPGGIRWTYDLFDVFNKQWGYDLKINLPSLFEEVGDWKKVRHNYAQTLLQLFIDRWARPYFQYCREKGLSLTGHYWEHTWPFIRLGPDNMAMYPWFQIPGVDNLFNQFNETSTNAQFGNVRSVKELSSVANQFGIHRTLCETYGGGGWDLTFADMKRLGDWEYALGVNMMNQHMSPISIEGFRKYDHPPYFTYHEPWWGNYKYLNKYFARLSVILSSGKQENEILVIEPTTSAWMYDSYQKPDKKTSEIGNSFQAFVTKLAKAQVEYDLGSESIIKDKGRIEKGEFIVGRSHYSTVIIPPLTENLNRTTVDLLKEYVSRGGRLILYSIPGMTDGSPDPGFSEIVRSKEDNIRAIADSVFNKEEGFCENRDLKFNNIEGGNLFHNTRIMEKGQILFLVNSSPDDSTHGAFSVSGKYALKLDPFTGDVAYCKDVQKESDRIKLLFSLPPAGSMILYITDSKVKGIGDEKKIKGLTRLPSGPPPAVQKNKDNVLMIDFVDLVINDQIIRDIHVGSAADLAFGNYGFHGAPYSSIQYNNNIAVRDTFSAKTGFSAVYHFVIKDGFDLSGMKAVIEHPGVWDVMINGKKVRNIPGEWWLDRNFGVYDIGKMVKAGVNDLTLVVTPMSLQAEIEPAYITGNFSVVPEKKGWALISPPDKYITGSWSDQGLPFYPWTFSYTKTFDIKDPAGYYEISPGNWNGTVCEVSVNGKAAGIIAFPPYTLDVSGLIQKGTNTIRITIAGSLKNLLGPHHNNPPKGIAISPHWNGIRKYPPGEEYQLVKYGLMDDFYLYQGERY